MSKPIALMVIALLAVSLLATAALAADLQILKPGKIFDSKVSTLSWSPSKQAKDTATLTQQNTYTKIPFPGKDLPSGNTPCGIATISGKLGEEVKIPEGKTANIDTWLVKVSKITPDSKVASNFCNGAESLTITIASGGSGSVNLNGKTVTVTVTKANQVDPKWATVKLT